MEKNRWGDSQQLLHIRGYLARKPTNLEFSHLIITPYHHVQTFRETYKTWEILILPTEEDAWSFHCCLADTLESLTDTLESLTDNNAYDSPKAALLQAKRFIDRQILRDKIDSLLELWKTTGRIDQVDYLEITQLLGELIRL